MDSIKHLTEQYISGFPSHNDYESFEKELSSLCQQGKLICKGVDPNEKNHLAILYSLAEENHSLQVYIPDQAYRGGVKWIKH